MTRKDYILIAAALRRANPQHLEGNNREFAIIVWTRAVESICDALSTDNPRFDRGRFYAACEA